MQARVLKKEIGDIGANLEKVVRASNWFQNSSPLRCVAPNLIRSLYVNTVQPVADNGLNKLVEKLIRVTGVPILSKAKNALVAIARVGMSSIFAVKMFSSANFVGKVVDQVMRESVKSKAEELIMEIG